VVAVDGRSGAGKSTLAVPLAAELGAPLVALEDVYPGWDGLAAGVELLVSDVLRPIAAGRPAAVPRWDWAADRWAADRRVVEPSELLVVEGVGCGARAVTSYLGLLIWVELDAAERRDRALGRDGDVYRGHWEQWAAQEDALLAADPIADRADLVIDAGSWTMAT
jgi:uridine kinase